jgi:hypothetical protein
MTFATAGSFETVQPKSLGEIDAFVQAIAEGGAGPIPFESMIATTLACLAAVGAHRPDIDVQAFLSKT